MRPVPTVAELASRGLAHPVSWTKDGTPTRWSITPAGNALLGRIMRENGLEAQMAGAADWRPPPSRQLGGPDGLATAP
jgi:hypothetical protein